MTSKGYKGRVDTSTRSVLVIGADDLGPIVEPRKSYAELLTALEQANYLLIDARRGITPIAAYAAGYAVSRGRSCRDRRRKAERPGRVVSH